MLLLIQLPSSSRSAPQGKGGGDEDYQLQASCSTLTTPKKARDPSYTCHIGRQDLGHAAPEITGSQDRNLTTHFLLCIHTKGQATWSQRI